MNYQTTCPCCGHITAAYTLNLNQPLAQAFVSFLDARIRHGRPVKKGELDLTNSQYSNFQNLRHFGIITQPEGKGGAWEATPAGWAWARGLTTLATPAAHASGQTLPPDHAAWDTHEGPRTAKRITDLLPGGWKERAAFQAEKTPTRPATKEPATPGPTESQPTLF